MRAKGPDSRIYILRPAFCTVLSLAALLAGPLAHAATDQPSASSATTKVRSEGCADGTTPGSRDAAVIDARRNAVWLWLELELGQAPGDEYLPLLDYLDHYTASFRLLGVHTEEDQTCVELDVYLYEWPMRADLAALLFRLRATPPRITFLFIELDAAQGSRKFQSDTRVSKLFTDAFREKGFTIVDASTASRGYSERELLSIAGAGEAALARYGAELGADAVVAVEVTLSAAPEQTSAGGLRAKAEIVARAVSTTSGRLHDRSRGDAETDCAKPESGYGFALPDAVYKVRDRAIVGAILAARTGAAGEQIRLTLEGVGDFVMAQRYAELLRTDAGVTDATVISVRAGASLLTFSYNGRMGELVDLLEAGAPGLPKLMAQRVTGSEMVLRAVSSAELLAPGPPTALVQKP